jgi:hypothetical protein
MRSAWQLVASNALRDGQPIPWPLNPLIGAALDANQAQRWRSHVAATLRACDDMPMLPGEWLRAQQAQRPTSADLATALTKHRELQAIAAAQGLDASDAGVPLRHPRPRWTIAPRRRCWRRG